MNSQTEAIEKKIERVILIEFSGPTDGEQQ